MIINLWSTPRTGSVWYSIYLTKTTVNSKLITEFFNPYHMNIYHTDDKHVSVNYHEYRSGLYYKNYYINNNELKVEKVYSNRIRNVEEEELYRIELFNKLPKNKTYILHNHVYPINQSIFNQLLNDPNSKNIFIYRKDRKQQLASYAVAYSTKKFAAWSSDNLDTTSLVEDINIGTLEHLVQRIKVWDNIDKKNHTVLAYEDINFLKLDRAPVKQNVNAWDRLSDNMKNSITNLLENWDNI